MDSFLVRFLASVLIDFSLAALAGLLLARRWLRRVPNGPALIPLTAPAASLVFALALQLLCLAATFTGKTGLRALLSSLPDIVRTHAGSVLCLTLGTALLLLLVSRLVRSRDSAAVAAFLCCLLFRSGSGHAATENVVSLAQALQFLHLASMAIWSGGVMLSGFLVIPQLVADDKSSALYLTALSWWSTCAVGFVAVTGVVKAYLATSGIIPQTLGTRWGLVLGVKIFGVGVALILGYLNRLALSRPNRATISKSRQSMTILRAEAIAMTIILVASAALANLPPPGE
ncbi:copper resistance D family protein [Terriglobus roseus]|uniref:Putative copper resistance protein D n=1 Tax=Terriglobus roseus TaxID=392734 RepID=A0A1H4U4N3_9BACT|nr:CopD family protein [Terriglobus roseus]SEC63560.1 putative copper resistance protein D [Terriglobus roseus]